MTALSNRISRLEDRSPWGSRAELAAAPFLVMRIPEHGDDDGRVAAARTKAMASGRFFRTTASPLAREMPLWRPVPLSRISDSLLDHLIAEVQELVDAEARQ